ncbi:hypothetical protein QBC46DRAFT_385330 [Diplogelasinospora grovesii]|uniref:Apple domain-containing protein n=1 Tax=Diplogelasinospora grovesii TaxID=303347 RepID=A0AAN6S5B3_9PEZI|nr:hypothetical protein QBC46DRAFT_385330 [Diplogelasinospora grovesii]
MKVSLILSSFCVVGSVLGAGTQNPFDNDDDPIPDPSGGGQKPLDPNSGGGGGGGGSQCNCPGDNKEPVGPLLDKEGCPATRAAAPGPGPSLQYASSPICPDADGKIYQTKDGATFYIQCCTHGASTTIRTLVTQDFRECMNECSKTDGCNSVQFVAHERANEPLHTCKLSKEGGYSSAVCGATDMHTYAFLIDPPAIEAPSSAAVACSTECPFANGQQFVTATGEAFHMDCGMRHGTTPIYRDRQATFKDCVQACGRLLACHSVDYDKARNICYYSNHQAEPTISAPGFASAHSMGCAGACGGGACGGCGGGKKDDDSASQQPQDTSPFPQDGTLGSNEPPEAVCPGSNGQIKTINGKRYKLMCDVATICTVPVNDIRPEPYPVRTLDECIADCSNNAECLSINYFTDGDTTAKGGRCNIRRCNPTPISAPGIIAIFPA